MPKFADHDEYIAASPEEFRPLLNRLRARLAKALPDAEELIAYDMPGFGFGKSIIAGYAAFSKQRGLYVSKGAIAAHADEIASAGLKATNNGVTFSPRKPRTIWSKNSLSHRAKSWACRKVKHESGRK